MPKSRTHNRAGDSFGPNQGIVCSLTRPNGDKCGNYLQALSSYKRHLNSCHPSLGEQVITEMVERERRERLGPGGERYKERKQCPLCKAGFNLVQSYKDHLKNTHGVFDEALVPEADKPLRFAAPGVVCPKCPSSKLWLRRDHLATHLVNVHKLQADVATARAARADDVTSSEAIDNSAHSSSDSPESSLPAYSESGPGMLAYIDPDKRQVRCKTCLTAGRERESVRMCRFVTDHLKDTHHLGDSEVREQLDLLNNTTVTENGRMLLNVRAGLGEVEYEEEEQQVVGEVPAEVAKATLRAPIGQKCECPISPCKATFTRKMSCLTHLKEIHRLDQSVVDRYKLLLPTVRGECLQCHQWFASSRLATHRKHCKPVIAESATAELEEAPRAFASKGKRFFPKFSEFARNCLGLGSNTARQYISCAKEISDHWEAVKPGFKIDALLFAGEKDSNVVFPSLRSLLNLPIKDSRKVKCIIAYKHMGQFFIEEFENRYGARDFPSMERKTSTRNDIFLKINQYDKDLRRLNKSCKGATFDKAAKATKSKTNLTYNPDRMKQIVSTILRLPILTRMKHDLINMQSDEIKAKYTESELRFGLSAEALLTTGGKRPSTVAKIRNCELLEAELLEDGKTWDVSVRNHKTAAGGPSHLSFQRENLYEACLRYQKLFKHPEEPDRLLFSTEGRKKPGVMEMKHSVEWLKRQIPEGVCTEEEKKTFTAKSLRKAFSNWGAMHPETAVVRATLETQDHGKRVDELFYKVASGSRVAYANQRIMEDVMDSTTVTDNIAVSDKVAEQSRVQSVAVEQGVKLSRGVFTQAEKSILLKFLPLKYPNKAAVDEAKRLGGDRFTAIWEKAVKQKGSAKEAMNLIWTSIRPKKRTVSRPEPESESSGSKSSGSESSGSESSGSESSESEWNEDEPPKKKTKWLINTGKTARVKKTPGGK